MHHLHSLHHQHLPPLQTIPAPGPSLHPMANEQLTELLTAYRQDKRVAQLAEAAKAGKATRAVVDGTIGSQRAFIIVAQWLEREMPTFIIADDKEEAAYLLNDLESLLPGRRVLFLPDSFKRPGAYEDLNPDNALQRTEVVNQLALSGPMIVVSYPEAMFEMVVDPEALDAKRIDVRKGENLDVDTLIELLVEFGFVRADFVAQPGEFSIRGGIVDVYSYANEFPYRIELFDEEVESIRTFDPGDQLSKANIGRVSIVPNVNTKFDRDQKVSILEVLPEGTALWIKDYQFFLDRLQLAFENAIAFGATVSQLDESELAELMRTRAFLRPPSVLSQVSDYALFFLKEPPGPVLGLDTASAKTGDEFDGRDRVVAGFSVSETSHFRSSPTAEL